MSAWIEVTDFAYPHGWSRERTTNARELCAQLEAGKILYFARPPFSFPEEDREFLTAQKRADSAVHKNVSFRPVADELHGFEGAPEITKKLQDVMRRYSAEVVLFLRRFLTPYDGQYVLDYASFRPIEEDGRNLPLHKRNDLLHVDAFPSRPTHGGRILRVFTNIHPVKPRVWNVGEDFPSLADRLSKAAGLERFAAQGGTSVFSRTLGKMGAPIPDRSAYDRFMLHFHDYLKEDSRYQAECPKTRIEFPPMSTWLVYTDGVPHAVMSGQHALEQTFIISRKGLVAQDAAPISVLEKISGRALTAAT